jgi:DNA segregation ATPase FtsK/SpoIIIE, S-DNA-T family
MTSSEMPPLLASWLKSKSEFADTVYGGIRRLAHRGGFHGLRVPLYLARLTLMSPRGLWRALSRLVHIVFDVEARPLRLNHIDRQESKEFIALERLRRDKVRNRLIVAAVLGFIVVVTAIVGLWLLPDWVQYAAMTALVLILGWVGRPIDKPIAKPATVLAGAPGPLKAPFVMEALCSLGIGGMRSPDDIGLLFDVARVGGGYQVDLELPRGVAAEAVLDKRPQLSAALRRELGTVWPSVGKRHSGHLSLFVGDQPMNAAKQNPWPLLKAGQVNVFQPAPFATDQQNRWVNVTLAYTSWIIGAQPRLGKTFAVRELLLLAGLDPRTKVAAIDLKGTGDLAPCALYADFYSVGDEPEDIDAQLDYMRGLRQEMRRRAKVIRELPHEEAPENKVTDVLANRKELGLEPIVVGADEVQVWFQHEDKAVKDEFTAICTDLTKRGPALGVWLILATQRPSAKAIPAEISDNAIMRFALKVQGQVANDMILGTSSYQAGVRATLFSFEDRGIGILKGDGADPVICRTVNGLDAPTAERVAARARQARQVAGRLTGHAAGEEMEREREQVDLLDDLRQVVTTPAVHLVDLVALLANLRPGVYGHLDVNALGAMLRSVGIVPGTVWDGSKGRDKASGKGVQAEWLASVSATAQIGIEAEEQALQSVST